MTISSCLKRCVLLALLLPAVLTFGATALAQNDGSTHPLRVHMAHWLGGSGKWRSPNPDYDPDAEARTSAWIKDYGVNWREADDGQHLIGEIIGASADGEVFVFSTMYAFYNPVTEIITTMQISRNGLLSVTEEPARKQPSAYGDPETADAVEYFPDGSMKILRHSNYFDDPVTQRTDVFEKNDGDWEQVRQLVWKRVED